MDIAYICLRVEPLGWVRRAGQREEWRGWRWMEIGPGVGTTSLKGMTKKQCGASWCRVVAQHAPFTGWDNVGTTGMFSQLSQAVFNQED